MAFRDLMKVIYREGSCVRAERDVWFANDARGGRALDRQRRRAWEACADCPVRRECLLAALLFEANDAQCWGVWGGVCAHDRRVALRRARRGADERLDLSTLSSELLEKADQHADSEGAYMLAPHSVSWSGWNANGSEWDGWSNPNEWIA